MCRAIISRIGEYSSFPWWSGLLRDSSQLEKMYSRHPCALFRSLAERLTRRRGRYSPRQRQCSYRYLHPSGITGLYTTLVSVRWYRRWVRSPPSILSIKRWTFSASLGPERRRAPRFGFCRFPIEFRAHWSRPWGWQTPRWYNFIPLHQREMPNLGLHLYRHV